METKYTNNLARVYRLKELFSKTTMGGFMLRLPLSLVAIFLLLPSANAVDNWDVDGANGKLYIHGALTESACRLEMESARQDVYLGEIGTGRLPYAGARGEPVTFSLHLADCLRSPSGSRDIRTGGLIWADNQPAVTVSFRGIRDAHNPQLAKAQGVSGMGLRLEDSENRDVRLGSKGKPLILTPGENTLTYRVTPERTSANLMAGSYHASIDFHLSYD